MSFRPETASSVMGAIAIGSVKKRNRRDVSRISLGKVDCGGGRGVYRQDARS